MGSYMTIESSSYKLDSSDDGEPTQRVARARFIVPEPQVEEEPTQRVARARFIVPEPAVAEEPTQQLVSVPLIAPDSQPVLSTTHNLSVVVPTRNEHANVVPLLESLRNALRGLRVEVIFVDDSDDDTPEVIKDAARTMSSSLFHIKLEHRLAGDARAGGLATAVVHGMNRTQAEYVAVIDADLQ